MWWKERERAKAGFWREDCITGLTLGLNCFNSSTGKEEGCEAKVSAPSSLLPYRTCPGWEPPCPGLHQGLVDQGALC